MKQPEEIVVTSTGLHYNYMYISSLCKNAQFWNIPVIDALCNWEQDYLAGTESTCDGKTENIESQERI